MIDTLHVVIYFASIATIIVMAAVATFDRHIWLGIVGTAGLCGIVVCALALFEYPPRPPVTGILMCSATLSVWSYCRWRQWGSRRDRRAGDKR